MKYYSEITKKLYDSKEQLTEAEEKMRAEDAEKKAAKEKQRAERAARAKEVDEALKASVDAHNKYIELRNKFIADYGYYHCSYTETSPLITPNTIWDSFLPIMF